MPSKKNIIVGAATLFIGPSGTATPAMPAAGSPFRGVMLPATGPKADGSTSTGVGTLVTNWREVGYTQDGLEVANDPSYSDVEVDQLLDAAKIFKDGMGLSISTTLAEATLENLLVVWGQAASTLGSDATGKSIVLDGGSLGEAPLERGLIAIGNATERSGSNSYNERIYHAYRVLSVEGSSHTLARADATVLPVTFRALPEDDGKYGVIRDRSIT